MRREADEHGLAAVLAAYELADVELAALGHLRRPRIADVRVVGPHGDAGAPVLPIEVLDQRVERLGHVAVAQVPRRDLFEEHRPVIRLGILHQPRVLDGIEEVVVGEAAVALGGVGGTTEQVLELVDDLVLAPLGQASARQQAIGPDVLGELVEAGVARAGPPGRLGVDLLEVPEHGGHRGAETVEVQAVEADLARVRRQRVVVPAQPLDELDHVGVAPHPGRKTPEAGQRFAGVGVVAGAAHVAVHARGVGPIGLDGDGHDAAFRDESLRDPGALAVELVRAVGRLPEEHEARIADHAHERRVVRDQIGQGMRHPAHCVRDRRVADACHGCPSSVVAALRRRDQRARRARAARAPRRRSSGRSPCTRGRRSGTAPA